MAFNNDQIAYFEDETGRTLGRWLSRWLDNQFEILREDALDIEDLTNEVQVSEYREIRVRMTALNNVLNILDHGYDVAALPNDFPYIKQELEDYMFFLEHDAIPDAQTHLMSHVSECDLALIKAVISMWPKAGQGEN